MRSKFLIYCWSFFLLVKFAQSFPRSEFFPFGRVAKDNRVPNKDESSTDEVELFTPFVFYGQTYFSYFINVNGIISFLTEIPYFFNSQFPLDYPVIAPFYSDIDTSGTGNIWYRETSDRETLDKVAGDLRSNFKGASDFRPKSVSIITYDSVGSYNARTDSTNTFQVVLITDSVNSYVIFYYADGGLQWLQGDGKTSGLPDALGQAGFFTMDGRLYTLRGSGTDQVRNLDKWSNVDQPGVWMFKVGKIEATKNIELPDIDKEKLFVSLFPISSVETCAMGGSVCHSSGSCIDYDRGFCCKCNEKSYGNGINCFNKEAAIRVSGKVSGNINGIDIVDGDLHSYALAHEGRTYTAISKVPKEVGYDLQSLTGIGEGIAWLFAVPKDGVSNGFAMTGGLFNRSVEIFFQHSGDKVEIQQQFQGLDVFNNVVVSTTVKGSLPTIPIGSELEVDAYKEEITRVHSGQLRSQSNRSFKLKGKTLETPYIVKTLINFRECENKPKEAETLRFEVDENIYMRYDEAESIVRFAFVAKIGTLEDEDPCIKGKDQCSAHSQCIVDGDTFRCVCEKGFEYLFDPTLDVVICLDINECDHGQHECDIHANCINREGSYYCRCRPGYIGDGFDCENEYTCANIVGCSKDSTCDIYLGHPRCRCNIGYSGDGYFCFPDIVEESCHVTQDCSANAACVPDGEERYVCRCLEGFSGNGYICSPGDDSHVNCHSIMNCSPYAFCNIEGEKYVCRCMEGYIGNGEQCVVDHYPIPIDPTVIPVIIPRIVPGEKDSSLLTVTAVCIDGVCRCLPSYRYNVETQACELDLERETSIDVKETVDPVPKCVDGRCTCPEGYVFIEFDYQCFSLAKIDLSIDHSLAADCFEGSCLCPIGYDFDADTKICHRQKLIDIPDYSFGTKKIVQSCNVINNCHVNAQCLYYGGKREYKCHCNYGFTGNGLQCSPLEEACDVAHNCHQDAYCLYVASELKSVCVCKSGYSGDGFVCTPRDDCSSTDDCNLYAQCRYDDRLLKYTCLCNEGYVGDGFYCAAILEPIVEQDTSCRALKNCDINAECLEQWPNQFECKCRPGFDGDGHFCTEVKEYVFINDKLDCTYLNHCGINADCVYNPDAHEYKCKCKEGYSGDGIYCEIIQNCLLDSSICDIHASCERTNSFFAADCVCQAGFTGNGFECQKAADHDKSILLMNQGLSILRMPIDSKLSNGFPIIMDPYMTAVGADIDCLAGRYYWTDIGSKSIRSSNYDGTERTPIISGQSSSQEDVAVDWVSKLIYWTDSAKDVIVVANTEGNLTRTIIDTDLVNPRGIAVHPGIGLLFWSDWNREFPKIEVSGMDGTDRKVLVSGIDIRLPNSLVVDYETTSICWADAGTHKIECIGVDGLNRRVIIEGIKYPFGLALHRTSFFYTDWNDTRIHEVNIYTGIEEQPRIPPLGGSGRLFGIVAVPDRCPSATNACEVRNGRCPDTYLCLPNGRGGRTCACTDDAQNHLAECVDYSHYL